MRKLIALLLILLPSITFAGGSGLGLIIHGGVAGTAPTPLGGLPQQANIVAAWKLNDDGTWADVSGNGFSLSEMGTVTAATGHTSVANSAADFDQTTPDYLYRADNATLSITGNISICGWVKGDTGEALANIVNKTTATGNQGSYHLLYNTTASLSLTSNGSTFTTATGATTISAGSWYHICGVYDGTDIRVYVNGSLDSNGSNNPKTYSSGIYDSTSQLCVGSSAVGTNTLNGILDDVVIWDTNLTAEEVATVYALGNNFE